MFTLIVLDKMKVLSMRAQSASVHNDLVQQGANEQSKNNTLLNDLLNAI